MHIALPKGEMLLSGRTIAYCRSRKNASSSVDEHCLQRLQYVRASTSILLAGHMQENIFKLFEEAGIKVS